MEANHRRILYLRERGQTLGQISRLTHTAIPIVSRILDQARREVNDHQIRERVAMQALYHLAARRFVGQTEVDGCIKNAVKTLKLTGAVPDAWSWSDDCGDGSPMSSPMQMSILATKR